MPNMLRDAFERVLREQFAGRPVGVDREKGIIRGYVVAMAGPFKSRRGEFDSLSLQQIAEHGNAARQGLKSRFSHPTECNDGLGKYLGRAQDFSVGQQATADGRVVEAVRADLHLDPTALETPPQGGKPLGVYVMDLAESDPAAISSSLVIRPKREQRLKKDGTPEVDDNGEPLPPLWRVDRLLATDIVDVGDAVDALLDVPTGQLPNEYLWEGAALLDTLFEGKTRDEVESRLKGFLGRYLDLRFGEDEAAKVRLQHLRMRQRIREIESRG